MRYYIDAEFNERPGTIDLISLALTCEDGRELYLESSEFGESSCNDWVKANVLPKLGPFADRVNRMLMRDRVYAFVTGERPEFWGYYSAYDHVVFCWLFGTMSELPPGWPYYTRDLKQEIDRLGLVLAQLPPQPEDAHHALADARWIRDAHGWIERMQKPSSSITLPAVVNIAPSSAAVIAAARRSEMERLILAAAFAEEFRREQATRCCDQGYGPLTEEQRQECARVAAERATCAASYGGAQFASGAHVIGRGGRVEPF